MIATRTPMLTPMTMEMTVSSIVTQSPCSTRPSNWDEAMTSQWMLGLTMTV